MRMLFLLINCLLTWMDMLPGLEGLLEDRGNSGCIWSTLLYQFGHFLRGAIMRFLSSCSLASWPWTFVGRIGKTENAAEVQYFSDPITWNTCLLNVNWKYTEHVYSRINIYLFSLFFKWIEQCILSWHPTIEHHWPLLRLVHNMNTRRMFNATYSFIRLCNIVNHETQ